MTYFILYQISNPDSLNFGLNIEQRSTLAAAEQFVQDLQDYGIIGIRLIKGHELGIDDSDGPLRRVLLGE